MYLLGEHRLICGDAREEPIWDVLFTALGVKTADAMWTDPPYGIDLQVDGVSAMGGDTTEDIGPLLRATLPLADQHLTPGAPWYVCAPTGRTFAAFEQQIERVGWHHAQTLVWVKNAFVPGRADYHHQHEAVLYGWKRGAAHPWLGAPDQSTVTDDEPQVSRMKREELVALIKQLRNARRTDVVREDKTRHNALHPTTKPTGLSRHMLANSTRRGAVVLDPFAGSGSTMVACELLGRRAAMIELEPRFCDVIVRRWEELDPGHRAERVRSVQTQPMEPIT
jgi:DNA modification methylase